MPLQALYDAGEELIKGMHQMMPGVKTEQKLIGFDLAESIKQSKKDGFRSSLGNVWG